MEPSLLRLGAEEHQLRQKQQESPSLHIQWRLTRISGIIMLDERLCAILEKALSPAQCGYAGPVHAELLGFDSLCA